jgi:integrase
MKKLNHQLVNNVTKPGRYFDGGNNLHLLVRKSESGPRKYFYLRVTRNGRRIDRSVGTFPEVSLSEARKLAIELMAKINSGEPIDDDDRTNELKKPTTFTDFASDWIELNKSQWSNDKHYRQWASTLEQYVYPIIGGKKLDDISTEDVMRILKPIWTKKTETASRIRERIERILNAAIAGGLRQDRNPASWRGHLQFLLPPPSKVKAIKHHASVPYAEVPRFYAKLRANSSLSATALRFLVLTAARTGEVIGCKWSEIENDTWVIPPERMKSRRLHRVPLSSSALDLLDEVQTSQKINELVFSFGSRGLSNMAMLQLLRRIEAGKTVHGFRSSFRIWAAEKSGCSSEAAELALAHVSGSVIERTYMRSDLLDLRRELMEAWARFVTGQASE